MKRGLFVLLFAAVILLSGYSAQAAEGDQLWNFTYPGSRCYDVFLDSNNDAYITGLISSRWGVKRIFSNGVEDSEINHTFPSLSGEVRGVIVDDSGNIYLGGSANNVAGPATLRDWHIIKMYPNGTEIWNHSYDNESEDDTIWSLAMDNNGDVYAFGTFYTMASEDDWLLIKYAPDGSQIWNKTYVSGTANPARAVVTDSLNNVIIGGLLSDNWVIKKIASNGAPDSTWDANYQPFSAGLMLGMDIDGDDNVYAVGFSAGDWLITKYYPNGTQDWNTTFNGADDGLDEARDVGVDSNNNAYVTGTEDNAAFGVLDIHLNKYFENGTRDSSWNIRINYANGIDEGEAVGIDSNNDVFICGYVDPGGPPLLALIKYEGAGGAIYTPPVQTENDGPEGTNLSVYNETTIQNVESFVWHSLGNGKIKWKVSLDLSGISSLDNVMEFGPGFGVVNIALASVFSGKAANITFEGVDCSLCSAGNIVYTTDSPSNLEGVRAAGELCSASGRCTNFACDNPGGTGNCTFDVTGFTGYAFGANSGLTINDSAEGSAVEVNTPITYFAFYVNSTSGQHISGASCNVTDGDGTYQMGEMANYYNYTKTSGFSSTGTKTWNVTCDEGSFTKLSASDTAIVAVSSLSAALTSPTSATSVAHASSFTISSQVGCSGVSCGDVSAYLDPQAVTLPAGVDVLLLAGMLVLFGLFSFGAFRFRADRHSRAIMVVVCWIVISGVFLAGSVTGMFSGTVVSTVTNTTPFYTTSSNPQSCGTLNASDTCSNTWTVYATGLVGTSFDFNAFYNSTTGLNDTTGNVTITITSQEQAAAPPAAPSEPAVSIPSGSCTVEWECGEWTDCSPEGMQQRVCYNIGSCKTIADKIENQSCTYAPTAEATCSDGIKNQDETDVDCGGSCGLCDYGEGCMAGSDCTTGYCHRAVCAVPTCSDGVMNQDEEGIDCGGPCAACIVEEPGFVSPLVPELLFWGIMVGALVLALATTSVSPSRYHRREGK